MLTNFSIKGVLKMDNAIDKLIDKIKEKNNPTVIGLDPRYDILPNCIKEKYTKDLDGAGKAILEFNKRLIDATNDIIPAVKPQIAFYEMFGLPGIKAFEETCKYAKEKGMIVIADMKRGDIGTTAKAYSNSAIGKTSIGETEQSIFDVEFVTVNPYLGTDGVLPFVEDCKKYGKGIFVLVKTSNKSSGELQDLVTEDGEKIYVKVAKLVNEWGKELIRKIWIQQYFISCWSNISKTTRRIKKNYATFLLFNTRLWSTRWKGRGHSTWL